MQKRELKKYKLPDSPGVYYFKRGREILYVGKATSLHDRVRSYFSRDLIKSRGVRIVDMVAKATTVSHTTTDSVLEALILEAAEIKKHQPYYNVENKDDKSFNYVVITNEEFPQVVLMRGRALEVRNKNEKAGEIKNIFGPFTSGGSLKVALRIIRKIFPYFDKQCKSDARRATLNHQIGLCPALGISKREYAKTIRNIRLFFNGKKNTLIKTLERDMKTAAKRREFEKAGEIKRQIFALKHIQDISLIQNDSTASVSRQSRIEAYDVAHMAGSEAVGVMAVVEGGEPDKSSYRKFKLSIDQNNDVAGLKEILERRLSHEEWRLPNLIVVDGGIAQKRTAEAVVGKLLSEGNKIPVVAVVKDERHRAKKVLGESSLVRGHERDVLLANAEAHRFAIAYHRKRIRAKYGRTKSSRTKNQKF